jgi:predicted acylesterase/phospholipase RssA
MGAAIASGCLRTSVLVQKFNEGVIETGGGDPAREPAALRIETAERRVEQELIDGYFGQHKGANAAEDPPIVAWLKRDARRSDAPGVPWFSTRVHEWLCNHGKRAHVSCLDRAETAVAADTPPAPSYGAQTAQRKLMQEVTKVAPVEAAASPPVCWNHELQPAAVAMFVDTIRYRLALRRAIEAGAALVDEGQIPLADLDRASAAAFDHSAAYLANRKWERNVWQHTAGLVVKGGASTGIFSAGAVWIALNIEHECRKDAACKAWTDEQHVSPRFDLMSGTSTGAMVATAADIYYASKCDAERDDRLELFEKWFVCSPAKDLYCTVNGTVTDLLTGHQMSLLEFDGLRKLLTSAVDASTLMNRSELLLNVVDFRTGRLYAFSDQDQLSEPAQVASAALASAALPVIVRPEEHLPSEPAEQGRFAYLDGGVRSELPLAAAIRRGAERLLVVSSSPSVMGEASERANGFDVLVRYIDVSTGGVLESEIDWAPRLAESRRLSEFIECRIEAGKSPKVCPAGECDADKLCSGAWSEVCSVAKGERPTTTTDAGRVLAAAQNAEDLLAPVWQTTSIYRDERRVPGLPGYLFRRADQRKLFLAGAEEARQRCLEIAGVLGLPSDTNAWKKKLTAWCAPKLRPLTDLCGGEAADEELRSCSEPLPPLSSPEVKCKEGTP